MQNSKAITVLEIIIICFVVGILAGLAIISNYGMKGRYLEKEAKSGLMTIWEAQNVYRHETMTRNQDGTSYKYFPPTIGCGTKLTADINYELSIELRDAADKEWEYECHYYKNFDCDGKSGQQYCCKAYRPASLTSKNWYITPCITEPKDGECPP